MNISRTQMHNEIVSFLLEGNTPEELARMVVDLMPHEKFNELLVDVDEAHDDSGDYPHTHAYIELMETMP